MPASLIASYAVTTLILLVLVALLAAALGTIAAWVVTMYRFPGRSAFAWALALPLAAPAYVLAYAWADLLDVAGPVRSWLRNTHGVEAFPFEIRSLTGAVLVLALALYPYVYLTVRAALASQPQSFSDAGRTLGLTQGQVFGRIALPLARPAIMAGSALVMMETLADFGAVQFLGVQTMTTAVVRAWSSYGAPGMAARISLVLLGTAALLFWIERMARGERRFASARGRKGAMPQELKGTSAWLASGFCLMLLSFALLIPAGWLAHNALEVVPDIDRLADAALRSLALGIAGATLTVGLACVLALGGRRHPLALKLASLGYATPGAVIAVGLLGPAALLWNAVPGAVAALGAAIGLLLYAYAARLMAAALEPLDAGLARVTPNMEAAGRMLGESERRVLARVHLPLLRGSLFTAGLLVFVDIMKELPATLILRPFDFDTLAVLAHGYASDERLVQAAWPSLLLVALAIGPVIFLSRQAVARQSGR